MQLSTHSNYLERWLGVEQVEKLSFNMRDWYGPPIAVSGVPGKVWAYKGGDFRGKIDAGKFGSTFDFAETRIKRAWRNRDDILHRWARKQFAQCNTGFTSLSDLILEATGGKRRDFQFQKSGSTGVVGATNTLWRVGSMPAGGSAGSAAPGGRAPVDSTTGGFLFSNPSSPDTQHFVSGFPVASLVNTLLLYDRIFDVAKTMNSTSTESVTGVPTRYQSSTPGDADFAGGNFLFIEIFTALAATAHNWTTCLYRDQDGNDAQTLPSVTGLSGGIIDRLDQPVNTWFCPLASGDTGIKDLMQMQCSANVATGAINFCIGHPIAWMPCPVVNLVCIADGINTAFNLARIFDDACLAFLEVNKPATGATNYSGTFITVSG